MLELMITVTFDVRNILAKLHLTSRAQALAYAIRTSLVTVPVDETRALP